MSIELSKETLEKIEKVSRLNELALDCIKRDIESILSRYVYELNTPKTRSMMEYDVNQYLDRCLMPFIREERLRDLGL